MAFFRFEGWYVAHPVWIRLMDCLNQSRYVAHQLLDRCDLPLVLVHGCAADGPPR